ncbi:peptidoglycan-associated lipoprotein Pal [Marinovum sp. 2_MG-2023]|uniref:peptidoglycan-associated lipoprotein Pal n=1 Tax=Roseobacteraceae TaxID=2854170 RepID=UPI001FD3730E|nr:MULTISPECIES: peptidoglycan-associated lipoprotein Pal [Roseobacteraceae]MCJ7873002.1 peptidoglycan-associated lipoprotein Pal [Phaeobacter sp. J2-8]MDO6731692.1 peptidoglycan-associated lipoprotein Pal [Marinovum sp. 2_MG-2023]MDO6780944.1 peptidoglycan-associated lipoprotein Pal [Marinovum sp. 1_MG-2023]
MKHMSKIVLLMGALAVSACTGAGRFDSADSGVGGSDFDAGAGAGTGGGLGDPTSPTYFQQAIGDRVLFVVDQSSLTSEAQSILNAQAQWLITNSDYVAVIEGHADEQGTREYNLALGGRRANAVREYLISQGVSASRLKFVTFGKERPIEICSEESCYAKNRRAVTVIAGGLTS